MKHIRAIKTELLAIGISFLILAMSIFYVSHSFHALKNFKQFFEHAKPKEAQAIPSAFFLGSLLGLHEVTFENFPLEPVEALANKMARQLQSGISRPIRVVSVYRKEPTPLAAFNMNPKVCTIVLNKNPMGWAQWNYFFIKVEPADRMNMVELSIAHEIGHCADVEQSLAAGINVKSKSILSGEVYADIFASIYAKEQMGIRAVNALAILGQVRAELSRTQPEHATSKYLHMVAAKINHATEEELDPSEIAKLSFEFGQNFPI
jgi:hypothetical protein